LYHFEKDSQAFFNILTEQLLVQKLTINQQKAHDLSYFGVRRTRAWHGQEGANPLATKDIEKKN
jgi:hypothetical protein